MTTLDTGITDVPLPLKRSALAYVAPALAVAGFVLVSLALKALTHLALTQSGLAEDAYGQCAEFIMVSGVSMFTVRKWLDAGVVQYNGRIIFVCFLAISILTMAFALSSGIMRVDFFISLLQISALCLFAFLQFWARGGTLPRD